VTYWIELRPRAAKQLHGLLKGVRSTIAQVIETLAENPRPARAVQLKGTDFMRVRVRDYRVVYHVRDDVLLVLVVRVGHRRDVYRVLR
jgi:mRNA interferase RelE/StbE